MNLKLTKLNNNIEVHNSGSYVQAMLGGVSPQFSTIIEITKDSYDKYLLVMNTGDSLLKLLTVDGKKVGLFHNNPFYATLSKSEDISDLDKADILICCHSIFLEPHLMKKCPIKTLFTTYTQAIENNGRYYLKIFADNSGLLPVDMFESASVLEGNDLLYEISKIKEKRIYN